MKYKRLSKVKRQEVQAVIFTGIIAGTFASIFIVPNQWVLLILFAAGLGVLKL